MLNGKRGGGVVKGGWGWFWGGGRATCRCAEGAQAAVFSAACLLSASCTPLCGAVGEQQCNSGGWRSRWWRSATPKTSSEIPPAGPESGSPDALTAAHYRCAAVNIPQSCTRLLVTASGFAQWLMCLMPISAVGGIHREQKRWAHLCFHFSAGLEA